MARLLRGNRSHIDGAAQIWAEATAFRDGDPDVAPSESSRPIIAGVMDRPRSVLIVAMMTIMWWHSRLPHQRVTPRTAPA